MITHKKKYGVYYWDTFDNETFLKYEDDDLDVCNEWVKKKYGHNISVSGADKVEIVDEKGNIIKTFQIK